jgi:organic hydroperoxide reductase OsmC/OhrA
LAKLHQYRLQLRWTGAGGGGTTGYAAYGRDYIVSAPGKADLAGSADAAFRGDAARWSPEELLLASLSACHQLWYLHLCAEAGVVVTAYEDSPVATMREQPDGAGQFESATLRPMVTIAPGSDGAGAAALHAAAAAKCFIARSVNFPVRHEPVVRPG